MPASVVGADSRTGLDVGCEIVTQSVGMPHHTREHLPDRFSTHTNSMQRLYPFSDVQEYHGSHSGYQAHPSHPQPSVFQHSCHPPGRHTRAGTAHQP